MKTRKLKDDTSVVELDFPIVLEVKTKAPEKWLLIDLETGEHYRGTNSVEAHAQWQRQERRNA
jgi:hypothetical protein